MASQGGRALQIEFKRSAYVIKQLPLGARTKLRKQITAGTADPVHHVMFANWVHNLLRLQRSSWMRNPIVTAACPWIAPAMLFAILPGTAAVPVVAIAALLATLFILEVAREFRSFEKTLQAHPAPQLNEEQQEALAAITDRIPAKASVVGGTRFWILLILISASAGLVLAFIAVTLDVRRGTL